MPNCAPAGGADGNVNENPGVDPNVTVLDTVIVTNAIGTGVFPRMDRLGTITVGVPDACDAERVIAAVPILFVAGNTTLADKPVERDGNGTASGETAKGACVAEGVLTGVGTPVGLGETLGTGGAGDPLPPPPHAVTKAARSKSKKPNRTDDLIVSV